MRKEDNGLVKSSKNPLIAAVLSIVLPGAGQIYNRQKRKALLWYVVFFLLPILSILSRCLYFFWGLVLLIFLYVCLYLFNIGDAIFGAIRAKNVKPKPKPRQKLLIATLVILILADTAIIAGNRSKNTIGLRVFRIITNSMAPSLQVGDFFMLDLSYYKKNKIRRGDLIAFHRATYKGPLCKRVIGLPGDMLEGKGNEVIVNGANLPEPYAQYIGRNARLDNFNQKHQVSEFGQVIVPEGQLFVLGDNRDNSFDSRDPDFGFVPIDSVWAKPLYIFFSTNRSRIGRTVK